MISLLHFDKINLHIRWAEWYCWLDERHIVFKGHFKHEWWPMDSMPWTRLNVILIFSPHITIFKRYGFISKTWKGFLYYLFNSFRNRCYEKVKISYIKPFPEKSNTTLVAFDSSKSNAAIDCDCHALILFTSLATELKIIDFDWFSFWYP